MVLTKTLAEINCYTGQSVNPLDKPEEIYELYSVPSYDNCFPEIVFGKEIGSTKVTIEEGDVLICKINPRINRVWVVKHYTEHPLLASSEWIIVRNSEMNSQYLKWFFTSPVFRQKLTSQVAGIGGSLTRAQPKQVAKYLVPVPEKKEQDRIAFILDKIEGLTSLRKKQLQKLDDLAKSRFVEMFSNERRVMKLRDVCSIITDGTHQPPKFVAEGIPFIFVSNITGNKLTYDADKFIGQNTYEELIKRTPIEIGDVLLSTVGSYGHPAVVKSDRRFLFQRHIAYLKPKKDIVDSDYLHGAILSPDAQRQIEESVKGIAQKTLNLSEIKQMRIPVPELNRQKQFSCFVAQVDKSKLTVQQSLDKLELLKQSLMQKYFG